MKKENVYKLMYGISALLLIGFCIRTAADYLQYSSTFTSAPFYLWVIVRAVEFILPGIIVFIAARLIKKKYE